MSAQLRRIGKSLIKYIKPVRVAYVHDRPRVPARGESFSSHAVNTAPQLHAVPQDLDVPLQPAVSGGSDAIIENGLGDVLRGALEPDEKPLHPSDGRNESVTKAPTNWLELVLGLLGACKRVSDRTVKRRGIETYRLTLKKKGAHRMNSVVGSIVDTLPEEEKLKRTG